MRNLLLLAALLFTLGVSAQDIGKLTGTITDQEVLDEGVVFAQVSLKGTSFKTQTNFRGNFEFRDLSTGNYTVQVTYPGYETLEIPVEIKKGEPTHIARYMAAKTLSFEDLASIQPGKHTGENKAESDETERQKK